MKSFGTNASRVPCCSFVALLALSAGLTAVTGCLGHKGIETPDPGSKRPADVKLSRRVVVAPIEKRTLTYTVDTVGTIEPERRTSIAAGITGVVDELTFKEGDMVDPKTTVLARINQAKYQSAVELAKANEIKAERRVALAQEISDRAQRLIPQKAISQEEATTRRLELEAAKAEFLAMQAARAMMERELEESQVRPPYAGQINERKVAAGDYVKEETVIATIADLSQLRLTTWVPEMAAARVNLGDELEFQLPALGNRTYKAKIFYLSTVADPQTHMFECKAQVPKLERGMKPGLFAKVQITTEQHADAVVVPEEAVRAGEKGFVVFVPEQRTTAKGDQEWVAKMNTVQLGFRKPGFVEVLSGVPADGTVVTRGSESLENNTPIELIPAEQIARSEEKAEKK